MKLQKYIKTFIEGSEMQSHQRYASSNAPLRYRIGATGAVAELENGRFASGSVESVIGMVFKVVAAA